jgi:hypothetical protein
MARMKGEPPKRPDTARSGVVVPPELAVGPCVEVWSLTGHLHDLISARSGYSRARTSWERAEGLDGVTSYRLLRASGPWSVTTPGGPDRLARLGLSVADIPALREAAQARAEAADPAHRRRS